MPMKGKRSISFLFGFSLFFLATNWFVLMKGTSVEDDPENFFDPFRVWWSWDLYETFFFSLSIFYSYLKTEEVMFERVTESSFITKSRKNPLFIQWCIIFLSSFLHNFSPVSLHSHTFPFILVGSGRDGADPQHVEFFLRSNIWTRPSHTVSKVHSRHPSWVTPDMT